MSEWIGEYRLTTPLRTTGSGSARWGIAMRGLERYFLKEFLSPVYPVNEDTPLGRRQRERCLAFERQKRRLYAAISCVIGDTLVPVVDFFRVGGKYYAISEAMSPLSVSAEEARGLSDEDKRDILHQLAVCLARLHVQGVIHADLKPEHVLLTRKPGGYRARLIDLDSGLLSDDPPPGGRDMEGDPVYLAPEAFLRMAGQPSSLDGRVDTFAFGALIHRLWTGELPAFDRSRYAYLYEAALDGASFSLSDALPKEYHRMVRRMLRPQPQRRPGDAELAALFAPAPAPPVSGDLQNPLSRYLRR